MGVCLSDPPSENLIKGAARENSAAWRCRLFAQIFILPIFFIDNDLPRGGYFESRAGKGNCLGGCFGDWQDGKEVFIR